MSIEVTSGSVTAVDTTSLRVAAARVDAVADRLRELSTTAQEAAVFIAANPTMHDGRAFDVQREALRAAGRVGKVAHDLRMAADEYEFIELRFRWMMIASPLIAYAPLAGGGARLAPRGDASSVREAERIEARWAELAHESPLAMERANERWNAWRADPDAGAFEEWGDAVDRLPLTPWGVPSADPGSVLAGDVGASIAALGLGVVPLTARLVGKGDPAAVRPMALRADASAPGSLREAAARIPDGETDSRIRVETYEMPGGGREHVVYLAGTQGDGDDAWDWGSNVELYRGHRSASYNGLEQALADAGIRPGEAVHEIGFSQGAMVGARMAAEGEYDVRSLISLGSPIDVAGTDGMLQVSVRHTDDVVTALANGGNPAEGVLVSKHYDPGGGLRDIVVPAHRLHAYVETAAEVDASTDPRLDELDELFARLGTARSATAVEFSAQRAE
ncbi:hypothetical protein [Microbacterium halophytorum]|uniref:hypothetical protein n=1 Tax=Microbacterium halophytorum TaxID=2067568 RepID=UPI000CFAA902|nr:hypothetical protein [Microbacterium halophytorum]